MPKTQQGLWFLFGACILAVLLPLSAPAQSSSGLDLERMTASQRAASPLAALLSGDQIPNSDVVDPNTYMVGPGDVISYQTGGLDLVDKVTIVTPENTLVLERYGAISCVGLTLQKLRDTLVAITRRRSQNIDLSISLRRPRLIYVTLSGNAPYTGTFMVPASMRVSSFLTVTRQPSLIGKTSQTAEVDRLLSPPKGSEDGRVSLASPISPYAKRNVILRHRSGMSPVDLSKGAIPGFEYLDPHLREGDEVIVPFDQVNYDVISISGAVGSPTTLAYRPGDRASILLAAAGGPTLDADLANIVLVSGNGDGKTTLSVDSLWQLRGEDPLLTAGSVIVVEKKVVAGEVLRQGVVELQGEVERPGTQLIVPGVTRLREVIERAGGLTSDASLSLSYVMRPSFGPTSTQAEREASLRIFLYSNLTLQDTSHYFLDRQFKIPFVSCDFKKAFADSSSPDNIRLQHGDVIGVPKKPDRIYVYGQVNQPGFVGFEGGHTIEWYVGRAGGFAFGSKPGRAIIVRGKTKVSVGDDEALVEAGDEVYVPRKPDVAPGTELQEYAVIASILGTVVAVTSAIVYLLR